MNRIRPAVWIMALGLTAVAPAKSLTRQQVDGGWVGKRAEENRWQFSFFRVRKTGVDLLFRSQN